MKFKDLVKNLYCIYLIFLSEIFVRLKKYNWTINILTEILELCSKDNSALKDVKGSLFFDRGYIKFLNNDYENSIADLCKAIELIPDNVGFYKIRGRAYYFKENYENALIDFNKVIELEPNNTKNYIERGIIKYNMKNYENSIIDFDKAIELEPDNAEYYYKRGTIKKCLNNWRGNEEDQTKAIELEPNNPKYYYERSLAKSWLNDFSGEFEDQIKAIKLNPKNPNFYYRIDNKAIEKFVLKLLFENKHKEAINILLTALKNCSFHKDIIFTALSFVYFCQKDYKKALKYANEAILFNKDNVIGF